MILPGDINRVMNNLRGIEKYLDNQIKAKTVLRKAARIAVNQMKNEAPEDEGVLKRSIKVLPSRKSRNSVLVGPQFKQKDRPSNHAHLVEFGHVAPNGKYIPGTPFISRTYEKTKEAMAMSVRDELQQAFERAGKSSAGFI